VHFFSLISRAYSPNCLPRRSLGRGAGGEGVQADHGGPYHRGGKRGLVLGSKPGVNPEKILEVLSGGPSANKVMEVKREKFLKRDFEPGGKVEFHRKDLRSHSKRAGSTGYRCRSRRLCARCSRP
jgi:hypothetical protein